MSPRAFYWRFWWAEVVPVCVSVPCALVFFSAAVPFAKENLGLYLVLALVLFVITRIPNDYLVRKRLLLPVFQYLRQKRERSSLSQSQLTEYYTAFANLVPKCQLQAAVLWAVSCLGFVAGSMIWEPRHRTLNQFFALSLTAAITAVLALAISYLTFKRAIRPLIEEVTEGLENFPRARIYRVPFRMKMGLTLLGLTVLGFLVFGLIISNHLTTSMNRYALDVGHKEAHELEGLLTYAYESEYEMLLMDWSVASQKFVLVDGRGVPMTSANVEFYPKKTERDVRQALERQDGGQEDGILHTPSGLVRIYPLPENRYLIHMVDTEPIKAVRGSFIWITLLFTGLIVLIVGSYAVWLTGDTARVVQLTGYYNQRLSEGDLTEAPAIWSDDELGTLSDSLRNTFKALTRMAREVLHASGIVDEEMMRVVTTSQDLHRGVTKQTQSVETTRLSVKATEDAAQRVSESMEQVASATQEVSSTILEMQASVEEIASNADTLIRSVEQTVSSSNEITASSEEISEATDQLHQNSQEAVSFLTELDAALEETRRNAQSLSEIATRVTQDAEGGWSAVAAVEEQILRTRSASEENKEALSGLSSAIERIGKIVDVIQDITEQTNLLSLNASIIAAGAGEHGKSFAVVATQIRELSAKTAGNAKEIRSVILSIKRSGEEISSAIDRTFEVVNRSTDLSQAAGESLRTILESSSSQEEMSKRIAIATNELAHGGQSASKTMHQIFSRIEGINKAAEEQATSTRLLNQESEKVREVALLLRNATDEQAKGAGVISEAVARITEDSQQTSHAMQTQVSEARAISEAMDQLAITSKDLERAFQSLNQASTRLQQSAATLNQELRAFRLSRR